MWSLNFVFFRDVGEAPSETNIVDDVDSEIGHSEDGSSLAFKIHLFHFFQEYFFHFFHFCYSSIPHAAFVLRFARVSFRNFVRLKIFRTYFPWLLYRDRMSRSFRTSYFIPKFVFLFHFITLPFLFSLFISSLLGFFVFSRNRGSRQGQQLAVIH